MSLFSRQQGSKNVYTVNVEDQSRNVCENVKCIDRFGRCSKILSILLQKVAGMLTPYLLRHKRVYTTVFDIVIPCLEGPKRCVPQIGYMLPLKDRLELLPRNAGGSNIPRKSTGKTKNSHGNILMRERARPRIPRNTRVLSATA